MGPPVSFWGNAAQINWMLHDMTGVSVLKYKNILDFSTSIEYCIAENVPRTLLLDKKCKNGKNEILLLFRQAQRLKFDKVVCADRKGGVLMDEKAMREKSLQFLMLCGPLEDAIDLIDAGKIESARALLVRMLDRAKEQAAQYREHK